MNDFYRLLRFLEAFGEVFGIAAVLAMWPVLAYLFWLALPGPLFHR